MTARRPFALVAAALLGGTLGFSTLAFGVGTAEAATDCVGGPLENFAEDVNGDGYTDIVAGDKTAHSGAGSVSLRYGTVDGVGLGSTVTLAQGDAIAGETSEAGDAFGASVTMGLLDGDHCADLAIGVPGEDQPGAEDAGLVELVFGSPTGLGQGRASTLIPASSLGASAGAKRHPRSVGSR